jgi:hypothetical protein
MPLRRSATRPVLTARATPGKRVVFDSCIGIIDAKIVSFNPDEARQYGMLLELVKDVPEYGKKGIQFRVPPDRVTVSKNCYIPKGCYYFRYITMKWTA